MRTSVQLFCNLLIALLLTGCNASMIVRKANKQFANGEYFAAAEQYGKAYQRFKSNEKESRAHSAFFRAECFRLLNQPIKAEAEYKKAQRLLYPNDTLYLRLGQALQKNAKYAEAAKAFDSYLQKFPDDTLALNGLSACHRIAAWSSSRNRYIVKKAEMFNSRKGDFSPVLMPEAFTSLFITSSAKTEKGQKPSKITGLPNNDFWVSRQESNGKWSKPAYYDSPINSEFDEGAACFSPDGKTMYFTRCVTKSDSIEAFSRAELFKSTRSGAAWSNPEKISVFRDSTKLYAHPAISPDGKYLYFVSDLKGGFGGKDLWRSEILSNSYGVPENLGPEINTGGDELFPSFRQNGTLYFASDGLPGFGGLDIFAATPTADGNWVVENLMQQINSSGDDFGITFFGKEDKGFFSSNRKEPRGWDKIYSFELPSPYADVQGLVADRYGEPIPDAIIRIINDKGLNTKVKADKNGRYTIKVEKDADYASARLYTLNMDKDTTYEQDFALTPLHKAIRMDNVLFAFGQCELLPESTPALTELIKIMKDNPNITVEIGAHTDRVGTDEYNNDLSEKRAKAVVDYLVKEGIEAARLDAKGYGKQEPATVDGYMHDKFLFLPEGTNLTEGYINTLTPEQQAITDQINRRCEFKVLKTTYKLF